MEFKFRAVDDRSPATPSSSAGHFSEQAMPASIPIPNTALGQYPEPSRSEMLLREIEKERIREEIIVASIARQRLLESELRRELMMEQEMAGRLLEERWAGVDPRMPLPLRKQFDAYSLEDRSDFSDLWQPLPQPLESTMPPENKDKFIVLDKPDPNLCGAKQNAAAPPTESANELPFAGIKNKVKEEWSCALCQASATSERDLKKHLQGKTHKAKIAGLRARNKNLRGKKHKVKIAGLRTQNNMHGMKHNVQIAGLSTQKIAKNFSTSPPLKISSNQANVAATSLDLGFKEKAQREVRTMEAHIKGKKYTRLLELRKKKFKFWCEMCQVGADFGVTMEAHKKGKKHVAQIQELKKMKSKFWCEMCKVGSESEVVMKAHKKGKKHVALLQKLGQNGEAIQTTAAMSIASSEADVKAKNSDELGNMKGTKIVVEGENTRVLSSMLPSKKTTNHSKVANTNAENEEWVENKTAKLPVQETKHSENMQNQNKKATAQIEERTLEFRKKFKFWCEMCQIGSESEVTREAHNKGKKHVTKLQELKKNKSKFWCEMCQVGANSKVVMDAHLKGKKHVAQLHEFAQNDETILTTATTSIVSQGAGNKEKISDEFVQAATKNKTKFVAKCSLLPSKNTTVQANVAAKAVGTDHNSKVERQSLQVNERVIISDKNVEDSEEVENRREELLAHKTQPAENMKSKNTEATEQREEMALEFRKKELKFWCETCQIGVDSEVLMDSHKREEKHIARLQELGETCETIPKTVVTITTPETSEKGKKHVALLQKLGQNGEAIQTTAAMSFASSEVDHEKTKNSDELENLEGTKIVVEGENTSVLSSMLLEIRKKKFKFWCEMCQVGADSEVTMEEHKKGKEHVAQIQEVRKMKSKFWCEMCKVGSDSEVVMEAHKKGKKHVALLQKLGQNGEAIQTTAAMSIASSEADHEKAKNSDELGNMKGTKVVVEGENTRVLSSMLPSKKTANHSKAANTNAEDEEWVENKTAKLPVEETQHSENLKNQNNKATAQIEERTLEFRKKFKFWCEMCQIGTESEVTWEGHNAGKKHVTKLQELKKNKSKFWCEMCQVDANSEVMMDAHLKGKKHVARLREFAQKDETILTTATTSIVSQAAGNKAKISEELVQAATENKTKFVANCSLLPSKNTTIQANVAAKAVETDHNSKVERQSLQVNERVIISDKNVEDSEEVENRREELLAHKTQLAEKMKSKNTEATEQREEMAFEFRKKELKFWGETCQIGVDSEVLMESHKREKKHIARLQELGENCKTIPKTAVNIPSPETSEKGNFPVELAEATTEKETKLVVEDENATRCSIQ